MEPSPARSATWWTAAVVYWVNPDDANDFRVVALDQGSSLQWAANNDYVLGSGASERECA